MLEKRILGLHSEAQKHGNTHFDKGTNVENPFVFLSGMNTAEDLFYFGAWSFILNP